MIKIVIVILLTFNLFACEPVQRASKKGITAQPIEFSCLSSQSQCNIDFEFGRLRVQFSGEVEQGKIKTELPFYIQLAFKGNDTKARLSKVASYLEGKSMFMGKIPVFFKKNEKETNIYFAEALLASCSEDVMTWQLWFQLDVMVDNEIKQQSVFVDFDSKRL